MVAAGGGGVRMASKDRPHREAKKKPKDKSVNKAGLQSLGDTPPQAEVIKPKRKPRWDEEDRSAE
jgi:hypothetical protein